MFLQTKNLISLNNSTKIAPCLFPFRFFEPFESHALTRAFMGEVKESIVVGERYEKRNAIKCSKKGNQRGVQGSPKSQIQ